MDQPFLVGVPDNAKVKPILLLLNRAFINNRGNIISFLLHPFVLTTWALDIAPAQKERRTDVTLTERNEVDQNNRGCG